MKKTIFLICLTAFIISIQISQAQNIKIMGKVVDNTLVKIQGVTITLTHGSDSSLIVKTVSDEEGNFTLSTTKKGPALLTTSHLAFTPFEINIPEQCDTTLLICLDYDIATMGNVEITGKRKTINYRDDGNIVVALENIAGYETDNAAQILRKLPGIMLSSNGQILLNGEVIRLQMDGFDVQADIMSFLNSLPAVAIIDVELISIISSKDSFGSGGIINLVSNKAKSNGHTAYINGSGMIDSYARADGSAGLFVMIKRNHLYINNSFNYEAYPHYSNSNDSTIYNSSGKILNAENSDLTRSRRIINNFNLAWDMKNKQSLAMNVYLFYGVEDRTASTIQRFSNTPQKDYNYIKHPRTFMTSGNIRYKTGDNLPFKIETSYGFIFGKSSYVDNINMFESGVERLKMTRNENNFGMQHIAKIDYSQKFFKDTFTIGAGVYGNFNNLDEDSKYNVIIGSPSNPNSLFEARENILGVYAFGRYNITKKLLLHAGIRAERTDYHINEKIIDDQSSNNYWNVIPQIYLNFRPSKAYAGTLAFSGSINRPGYELLMPGTHYFNDHSYETGNPYLTPLKHYRVNLRSLLFEYFSINISGAYIKDLFSRIAIDKGNNITEYTYKNVVDRRDIALNIGLPFRAFKEKLTGQLNYSYSFGDYLSPKHGFIFPANRNRYEFMSSSLHVNYQIIPRFDLTGYLNYQIKYKGLQSNTKSYATFDLSAQFKVTKNERLILNLYAYDIFNSKKIHSEYFYDDVQRWNYSLSNSQHFSIGISYKFMGGKSFKRDAAYDPNDTSRFFGE